MNAVLKTLEVNYRKEEKNSPNPVLRLRSKKAENCLKRRYNSFTYGKDKNNIIVLRFCEVYLNYAEAKLEQNTLTQTDLDISMTSCLTVLR